jgi:hypothetical protein
MHLLPLMSGSEARIKMGCRIEGGPRVGTNGHAATVDDLVAAESLNCHRGQQPSTRPWQQIEMEGLKNECFP